MNTVLTFKRSILLFVEMTGILRWVLDAEDSVWLRLLMLFPRPIFLHICIANLVVFVPLKLTFIASKNIIKMHRAGKWLHSLTIFTPDPIVGNGSFLHLVHSQTLLALKIKLRILLVTWFEYREPNFVFFPFVIDLNMLIIEMSRLTIFELFWVSFDCRKNVQICDTIYTSLPSL